MNEMNEQEKSAVLARAIGGVAWEPFNFYDPANMPLLARVIEWAIKNESLLIANLPALLYFQTYFKPEQFHASMCEMADDIVLSVKEGE